MKNYDGRAELFVEALIKKSKYEVIRISDNGFLKLANETFLILAEAGGTKLVTFGCSCGTVWECNAIMIIVGNEKVKGLVVCPHCETIGLIEFILPPKELLIKMFNIEEKLVNEHWFLEKQQLQ
jgi:hypothetical protein